MKLGAFIGGLLMGGIAGIAFGVLSAPKAGKELREDLVGASENIYRKAAYEIEELADKVEDLRSKIDLQDFSPKQVAKNIEETQAVLKDTRATTSESQEVLARTDMNRQQQS